jgi:hypothetical protein
MMEEVESKTEIQSYIGSELFEIIGSDISDFNIEKESQEYKACNFLFKDKRIVFRKAKVTPKKVGQFVTFWKRNNEGIIEPFEESDELDYYLIHLTSDTQQAVFLLPKNTLIEKGILSTKNKDGKRGFRVYPKWDIPTSKQAIKTQNWQLDYFLENSFLKNLPIL